MTTNNIVLATLDDNSLLDAAKRLAIEERRATAALLRALMEYIRSEQFTLDGLRGRFLE